MEEGWCIEILSGLRPADPSVVEGLFLDDLRTKGTRRSALSLTMEALGSWWSIDELPTCTWPAALTIIRSWSDLCGMGDILAGIRERTLSGEEGTKGALLPLVAVLVHHWAGHWETLEKLATDERITSVLVDMAANKYGFLGRASAGEFLTTMVRVARYKGEVPPTSAPVLALVEQVIERFWFITPAEARMEKTLRTWLAK